jgi:hypothetical protein
MGAEPAVEQAIKRRVHRFWFVFAVSMFGVVAFIAVVGFGAVLIGSAMSTFWGDDVRAPSDSALREVHRRLEQVGDTPPFRAPPNARHFTTELQERCIDLSFDRTPPYTNSTFTITDYDADTLVAYFEDTFAADGWTQHETQTDDDGSTVWLGFDRSYGDWQISAAVMIQTRRPMLVSVEGYYGGPGDCDDWIVTD